MRRMIATSSAMTTGALAGAMTLIRLVLVPFWRRCALSEFKPWFRENAPRLRALMVPLGAAAAGTTTANALITRRGRAALGAAAAAGVAVVTMAINEPLNARFEGPDPIEPAELDRWVRWHDLRVALGLLAAWASAGAMSRS
jgi:Anthrone oxygenase